MSDVIEIRGLRVSAVVGVLREERDRPQPLTMDIDIERPFEEAAINDDVGETTDYSRVLSVALAVAREGRFLLLETLAYRVAHEIVALDPAVTRVNVAVRKLRPPVPEDVDTVGVRTTVSRP